METYTQKQTDSAAAQEGSKQNGVALAILVLLLACGGWLAFSLLSHVGRALLSYDGMIYILLDLLLFRLLLRRNAAKRKDDHTHASFGTCNKNLRRKESCG